MIKLEEKQVNDLFFSCLFEQNEVVDGRANGYFTAIESIAPNYEGKCPVIGFCTKRLNQKKHRIIEVIDALPKINEGILWDELYFDSEGNKWCQDIKTIDQLVMMGLACEVVSHTIVEDNGKKISIIKRTKENDRYQVAGQSPEDLPQPKYDLLPEYTPEEWKLVEKNRDRITKDLNENIEIIQTGFSFIGIKASLNQKHRNVLDFYSIDDEYLVSKKFADTDGIIGIEGLLNQRLTTEFWDCKGSKITYLCDGDRHIFLRSSEINRYVHRIELTKSSDKKIERIEVSTTDPNADYIIKKIKVDSSDLEVELNNQFGPYGNYEDGIKRSLWYRHPLLSNDNKVLYVIEAEWPEKGHILSSDGCQITIDDEQIMSGLSAEEFYLISSLIVSHPRNREIITFTTDELDKQIPGIKQYIYDNFPLYNLLTDESAYESMPIVEDVIEKTKHEKCNIKQIKR